MIPTTLTRNAAAAPVGVEDEPDPELLLGVVVGVVGVVLEKLLISDIPD